MSINSKFVPSIQVDVLFKFADVDGDGVIGAADAQFFFTYTNLKSNILAMIWSVSVPAKKPMTLPEFALALVLIYHAQQGTEITKDLIKQPPPFNAPNILIPFFMDKDVVIQCKDLFNKLVDTPTNHLSAATFDKNILNQYPGDLTTDKLLKICDYDNDGEFDCFEFISALALLKNQKAGYPLPKTIPIYFKTHINEILDDCATSVDKINDNSIQEPQDTFNFDVNYKEKPSKEQVENKSIEQQFNFEKEESTNSLKTEENIPTEPHVPSADVKEEHDNKKSKSQHGSKDKKKKTENEMVNEKTHKKEKTKKTDEKSHEKEKGVSEKTPKKEKTKETDEKTRKKEEKEKEVNEKARKKEEAKKASQLKKAEKKKKAEELQRLKKEEKDKKKLKKSDSKTKVDHEETHKDTHEDVHEENHKDIHEDTHEETHEENHDNITSSTSTNVVDEQKDDSKDEENKIATPPLQKDEFTFDFSTNQHASVSKIPTSVIRSIPSTTFSFDNEQSFTEEKKEEQTENVGFSSFSFGETSLSTSKPNEEEETSKVIDNEPKTQEQNIELLNIEKELSNITDLITSKTSQIQQLQSEVLQLKEKVASLTTQKQQLSTTPEQPVKNETIERVTEEKDNITVLPIAEEEDPRLVFGKLFSRSKYGFEGEAFEFPIKNENEEIPFSSLFTSII
ncbi:hypothetical protein QTN25_000377 [Entamoeba marina]